MEGLSFKKLNLSESAKQQEFTKLETTTKKETVSKRDIAVIGLSCQIASAKNAREYWDLLESGTDAIRDYPRIRLGDVDKYLEGQFGQKANTLKFHPKAYMDEIDKFDYQLFSLSPTEASVMDPNQRLFLETVWSAIEDAGYGGKKLVGSNTGVYVGFCNLSLDEYLRLIEASDPELFQIAVPGNIKSIIASRISYLLDLKGPSMLIDTACSSSLTAVHVACQAIRSGDCEQALVGGVKLNLTPGVVNDLEDIGIAASDGRTKTFDDGSDGTGGGEGVAAVLLKPLHKALEDGDHVYAVIKGTAINQDGTSVGITAPNSAAQEAVITKAWDDARIDPSTISYMEAHGTGTNLGDPVEITGVERAFKKYTDRKQFCAIGSVKTNIGHLDGAAGIAGLVKVILSLHHKKLPPSLHFKRPNRKISFVDSPVYINDKLQDWNTSGHPRRCGISSFGLSGTNAHIVLEEAPEQPARPEAATSQAHVLTLSAKTKDGVKKLASDYIGALQRSQDATLADICATANTGRGHYQYRAAIVAATREELADRLTTLLLSDLDALQAGPLFYGEHKIVSAQKQLKGKGEITEEDKRTLTWQANSLLDKGADALSEIARLYAQGADVEWEGLYAGAAYRKLSLPVYPFARKRCWIEWRRERMDHKAPEKELAHPLFNSVLVKSKSVESYRSMFSIDRHWELREHVLNDHSILPGTAYIEMAREVGKQYYETDAIELQDVLFTAPLVVDAGQEKEVHTNVAIAADHLEFSIVSKGPSDEWVTHAEGKIYPAQPKLVEKIDVEFLKANSSEVMAITNETLAEAFVNVGPRWRNIRHLYLNENQVLAEIHLSEPYVPELQSYYLYPSLLDGAVNAANGTIGDGLYLPLHYGKMRAFQPIPAVFYSFLQKKSLSQESSEVATFDIVLLDEHGNVFAEIEDYTIKKLHDHQARLNELSGKFNLYYETRWVGAPLQEPVQRVHEKTAVVFSDGDAFSAELIESLRKRGYETLAFAAGDRSEDDYFAQMEELKEQPVTDLILSVGDAAPEAVYSLFSMTRALLRSKWGRDLDFTVVARNGYEVTGEEAAVEPHNAALYGLAKVVGHEYPHIRIRAVDLDEAGTAAHVVDEVASGDKTAFLAAYRNGARLVEEFDEAALEANAPIEIKETGVYVITGGLGGIGLEAAKFLTADKAVSLALLGRSEFPGRAQWNEVLEAGTDERLCRKIREIQDIERNGSRVQTHAVDIADAAAVQSLFAKLRAEFGSINGLLHSAGVAGDGYLIRKERDVFEAVLKPKVLGTTVLHEATVGDDLDFFVMCSSLTSVFGAPGQGDYTAANSYQDAFAAYRRRQGLRAATINWAGWGETGMAVDHGVSEARSMFKVLSNAQGVEAFARVLNSGAARVLVGEIDSEMFASSMDMLPIQLNKGLRARIERDRAPERARSGAPEGDLVITGKAQETLSHTEHEIAKIWSNVLGMNEIDVYDKFFEIGGDSLLASHLLKEIDKTYPNAMDITDVFIYSTVVEMAATIENKTAPKAPPKLKKEEAKQPDAFANLDDLLEKLAMGEIAVSMVEDLLKTEDE